MNPIIMHINYCEQGQTIDEVCRNAAKWGYDGIEFRAKVPDKFDSREAYVAEIKRCCEKHGLKHIHFGYMFDGSSNDDESVRDAAVADAAGFFKLVNRELGVNLCNLFMDLCVKEGGSRWDFDNNGSAAASERNFQNNVDTLKKLNVHLEKMDFYLALETHMNYIHDLALPTRKFVDALGKSNIGINIDYCNNRHMKGIKPLAETIDIYGDKLYYFHLKNSVKPFDSDLWFCVALSQGEINHRELLKIMRDRGYTDCPIVIEAPRDGDREFYAQEDIKYLKWLINDLKLN